MAIFPRLNFELSSLQKDCKVKQLALEKAESKLDDLQAKYDSGPRQEVVDRYRVDWERNSDELKQAKEILAE